MTKLYALSTCPWCKKTKKFFNDNGIPFEHVDVDTATGDQLDQALSEVDRLVGERAFPITIINGTVIVGYKPDDFLEALRNGK